MSATSTPPPRLVRSLAQLVRERPLERKIVVAPSFGAGRELLRRLALEGVGWIGLEVTTVRPLALRLAQVELEARGLRPLDPFDQQALLDEALDSALRAVGDDARLGEVSEGVGFRRAVHEAVLGLRRAGLSQGTVRGARMRDVRKRRFLARVLDRYEALLSERRRADTATILALAVDALHPRGALPHPIADAVLALVPGLPLRGLDGRMVEVLRSSGARLLATDPVRGLEAPGRLLHGSSDEEAAPATELAWLYAPSEVDAGTARVPLELFRAASRTDELREVLRRVVERGLAWDEVEIVATDVAAYGSAMHALASRMGLPVTYAVGLPVERTRPGRVVRAYLDWIREGFPADPIRRLLEAGDLVPARRDRRVTPATLARRFRALRIGWGRLRYRRQLRDALAALGTMERRRHESEDQALRRIERARFELEALRSILFPALKATPTVPDRLGEGGEPVSPAEIARGLRAFLRRVPRGSGADAVARDRIVEILDRVEATLRRRTDFEAAVTILGRHLEFRVRAPEPRPRTPDDAGAPWRSEGGHLHVADLEHGGFTGRSATFIVGLDADGFPGAGSQDPVLLDAERVALGGALPTSLDTLRERVYRFAAFAARVRGSLTLSYTAWNAADARAMSPSPVLLQALRLRERDGAASYEMLHAALGAVRGAFPGPGRPALDRDDVWMDALLARGGVLRSGTAAVRAAFPRLDGGLAARDERLHGLPGPHHGALEPRPELLDPRLNPEVTLSASALERLGACGMRYLYHSVLRLRAPDDPELDPDRWLDPLRRGNLLHAVYERTLRIASERGIRARDPALDTLAQEVLASRVSRARVEVPAPGEGVVRREVAALEEDVRSFVRLVREEAPHWTELEMGFGRAGEESVVIAVAGGEVHLRGAVDRVDEDLSGLRVVDYKTGVPFGYGPRTGAFDGGRRLQHAVYAAVAEKLLRREVVTGEYHFPTRRGENTIHRYERERLEGAPDLIGHLLDAVADGAFLPTDSGDDCRFCDFAAICRVSVDAGRIDSPLAEWSREMLNVGLDPRFRHLKAARAFEGG